MNLFRRVLKRLIPQRFHPRNLVKELIENTRKKMVVRGGPFAGMHYTNDGYGVLNAKLFGTYECELWDIIRPALMQPYDRFIDVGAGEGYYAVGFALKSKSKRVIAYDSSAYARNILNEMAEANKVRHHIELRGECDPAQLEADLQGGLSFLMMDVEGAEECLLDPVKIPGLKNTFILFESHDIINPGIGGRVVRRFLDSHNILEISARYRRTQDLEFLPQWLVRYLQYDLLGHLLERPDQPERMRWFYLEPKVR